MEIRPELRAVFSDLVRGQRPWPLFLFGDAGVGKSRAALALCDHVPGSYYLTIEQVCTEVLERTDGVTWRYLPGHSLVACDELATRKTAGDLEYTTLKRIADVREDLPAIYISNVMPGELIEVYDERLGSRLLCGTIYRLVDRDRRRDG